MTEAPPFPLPLGHTFGPAWSGDLRYHDGRNPFEGLQLLQWQRRYVGYWRRPQGPVTGRYDGPTQKAIAEVQGICGLPVTGLLGPQEWASVWEREPPAKPEPPPKAKTLADDPVVKRAKRRKRWEYWDRYSKWHVRYGSDPNAPHWYPGRPFSSHEKGPHVKRVQELLGLKPTGIMNPTTVRVVKGWQEANQIPVSGVVDARTASLLESTRSTEPGSGATLSSDDQTDSLCEVTRT